VLANGIAFVIFIVDGQVVWRFCVAAMVAAAIGGYVSASLARRVPQPVLRGLVVAIGLVDGGVVFCEAVTREQISGAGGQNFDRMELGARALAYWFVKPLAVQVMVTTPPEVTSTFPESPPQLR